MVNEEKPEIRDIERLRNLGAKSAGILRECGVTSEGDLRKLGAVEAFRRAKAMAPERVSLNLLWALQGALMDMDWRDMPPEIKARVREEAGI